jgi:hypothetical protein
MHIYVHMFHNVFLMFNFIFYFCVYFFLELNVVFSWLRWSMVHDNPWEHGMRKYTHDSGEVWYMTTHENMEWENIHMTESCVYFLIPCFHGLSCTILHRSHVCIFSFHVLMGCHVPYFTGVMCVFSHSMFSWVVMYHTSPESCVYFLIPCSHGNDTFKILSVPMRTWNEKIHT